jgi:hypothetical protein
MAAWRSARLVPVVALLGALSFGWIDLDTGTTPPEQTAPAEQPGFDVGAVVERLRHSVAPVPGRPATLGARDDAYDVTFDGDGLRLAPSGAGDQLRVGLVVAARGAQDLAVRPGSWRGDGPVASRPAGTGLVEQVTAREGEVEWDVVLDREPAGSGDLQLDATLRGVMDGRPAGGGWHLALDGGSSVRLGEAVVVDAHGTPLHRARPDVQGHRLRMTVPADVLEGAAYPLTVDPVLAPEHPVTPVAGGPGPAEREPAIAFDGTNSLVVWSARVQGADESGIFGARINAAGVALDRTRLVIDFPDVFDFLDSPAVAFGGGSYAVVSAGGSLVRVSTAGVVTGSLDLPIGDRPTIASNGTDFLVAWEEGGNIAGALVEGDLSGSTPLALSTASGTQSSPTASSDGSGFLVAWADTRNGAGTDIFGTRVNATGMVLNPSGVGLAVATGSQDSPALAFGGGNHLLTWHDNRTGSFDIRGTRVSPTGTVLDTTHLPISTAANNQSFPAVAFDGTRFLVAHRDRRGGASLDVFATRVSTTGVVQDGSGIALSTASGDQIAPAVGARTGGFLVGWEDVTRSDILGRRVAGDGTVPDAGVRVLSTGNDVQDPAVGFDGTNFLVVWAENPPDPDSGANGTILAARVAPDGTVLGRLTVAGPQTFTGTLSDPAVSFDGTNYLVVFTGSNVTDVLRGQRMSPAGSLVGGGFVVADDGTEPAVAFNGTDHLVTWRNSFDGDIEARFVSPGGGVDPDVITPASGASATLADPAVASGGGTSLVAWTQNGGIRVARVSGAGVVADPAGDVIDSAGAHPAVGWTGANFLTVWDETHGSTGLDIVGKRISTGGAVLDASPLVVSGASGTQQRPVAASNGPVLVAWDDRRNMVPAVFGARVAGDGTVQDPPGLALGTGDSPALSRGPGDDWGVVYDRFDTTVNSDRVFFRTLSPK